MQIHRSSRLIAVTALVALAPVLGLVTASCANGQDSSSGDATSAAMADAKAAGTAGAADEAVAPDATSAQQVSVRPNEKKIRTGTVTLSARADRVAAAASQAVRVAETTGGEVSEQRSTGGDQPTADLVLRIPPERFRDAIARLGEIATVTSSQTQTQDVTGQYADLDGRLETMRISVLRLQGFLGKATDVNQIASLEAELTRREAELESTQAQLDALAGQVELATIDVSISTRVAPLATTGPPSPGGALATGWDAFVSAVRYLAAGVAISLPFLVLALIGALTVRRFRRPRPITG